MTRDVLYATAVAVGFAAAVLPATAGDDALKVCAERYNLEKSGGTIPVGMSKSTYMNQCIGSIRRAAKLEQELAEQSEGSGSSSGVTAAPAQSEKTTTNKPARLKTPTTVGLTQAD